MSTPHEVLSELLSPSQGDRLQAAGESAWAAAADALASIFGEAPAMANLDARLAMPDEIAGDFEGQHLVMPVEVSTNQEQSATAWLVFGTAAGAGFLNSEADNADDQEQQTIVMASTVLGQAVRAINAATLGASLNGLVLSLDDVSVDNMPEVLGALEDPCLVLKGTLAGRDEAELTFVLPGGFLDIVAGGFANEEGDKEPTVSGDDLDFSAGNPDAAQPVDGGEDTPQPTAFEAEEPSVAPPTGGPPLSFGAAPDERAPRPISSAPTAHRAQFAPLSAAVQAAGPSGIDLLAGLEMNVSVELGRTDMTVADVLALGPGSVVELDRLAGEPVDILVNDRLIARGEVVVVDENFGVRVVEVIRRDVRSEASG